MNVKEPPGLRKLDTKDRNLQQVGGRVTVQSPQGRKESDMKGRDDVGRGQQNYVEKGGCVGKVEEDETGVFQLECPSRLHEQGTA